MENTTEGQFQREVCSVWHCNNLDPGNYMTVTFIAASLATFICGSLLTLCIIYKGHFISKCYGNKERVLEIVHKYLWEYEDEIEKLLSTLTTLSQHRLNGNVHGLHLLAFYVRSGKSMLLMDQHCQDEKAKIVSESYKTVLYPFRLIERFVETMYIHLPVSGHLKQKFQHILGLELYRVFTSTAMLWSEHQVHQVHKLCSSFLDQGRCRQVSAKFVSYKDLAELIKKEVPYHQQLVLWKDRFLLQVIEVTKVNSVDLASKIRFVDNALCVSCLPKEKQKSIKDWLKEARDICISYNLAPCLSQNGLSRLEESGTSPQEIQGQIFVLKHLFRIMCMEGNLQKLEGEDRFFQFLMQLYEPMYNSMDTTFRSQVIEHSKNDIAYCLKMLNAELLLIDREKSRHKLEHVARELGTLLAYLSLKREEHVIEHAVKDKADSNCGNLYDVKVSEASQSTRTASRDSLLDPETQPLLTAGLMSVHTDKEYSALALMHQQASLTSDHGSWVSGSSMYATAPSVGSGDSYLQRGGCCKVNVHDVPIGVDGTYDETAV